MHKKLADPRTGRRAFFIGAGIGGRPAASALSDRFETATVLGRDAIDDVGVRANQYAQDHQSEGRPWTWADRREFRSLWGARAWLLQLNLVQDGDAREAADR